MTDAELLTECKVGLDMQPDNTAHDAVLRQKLVAVKSFLRRAGVSDETLASEDAVGVIVMGVADLWNQQAGEVKFSPAFYTMASQLAMGD